MRFPVRVFPGGKRKPTAREQRLLEASGGDPEHVALVRRLLRREIEARRRREALRRLLRRFVLSER